MNRVNLQKMADHIKTIPQEMFDMGCYRRDYLPEFEPECKTIGCVIGHCTVLDPDLFIKIREKNFPFDVWSETYTSLATMSREWCWCFSDEWQFVDNTPLGASKRIEWIINNGLPENWQEQMCGKEELCY